MVKVMCTRCPVLDGITGPSGHLTFDFCIISSWKLLLRSISVLLTGRRSSNQTSVGCAEHVGRLQVCPGTVIHPLWLSLLPLIRFWLSMKLNLQIAACFFALLHFFF